LTNCDELCTDCSEPPPTCVTSWDTTDGFGTIDSTGTDYIILSSTYQTSPFGYNMIRIRPSVYDAGACCSVVSVEVLSGDPGSGYGFTGEFPSGQTILSSLPATFCAMQWEKDGAEAPFSLKITFG